MSRYAVLRPAVGLGRVLVLGCLLGAHAGCGGGGSTGTGDVSQAETGGAEDDASDGVGGDGGGPCGAGAYLLASGGCVTPTLTAPAELEAQDGIYRLELGPAEVTVDGERHCVRAYNGAIPGPTIRVPKREGDAQREVRVDIVNQFATSDCQTLEGESGECGHDMGGGGHPAFDFNETNLHFHGSHVRPDYSGTRWSMGESGVPSGDVCAESDGVKCASPCDVSREREAHAEGPNACPRYFADNVLYRLGPGAGAKHRYDIDEDYEHHEGLHWYHPHIHGSTAIQVGSGAAGAIIVEGELDDEPVIRDTLERVLVMGHWPAWPVSGSDAGEPLADGEACTEDTLTVNHFELLQAFVPMINGQVKPRAVTAPGEVERWRLLHAGTVDEVFVGIFRGDDTECESWSGDPLPLTQYARDGVPMPQTFEGEIIFMSPGYRVEGLIQMPAEEATLCVVGASVTAVFDDSFSASDIPDWPPSNLDEALQAMYGASAQVMATWNVVESKGARVAAADLSKDALEAALAGHQATLAASGGPAVASLIGLCDGAKAATPDHNILLQVGVFEDEEPVCECSDHNVNCQNFEHTDRELYPIDRALPAGGTQHWRVSASQDGHPYHIHINPFLVCPEDDGVADLLEPNFAHMRDTYLVNFNRRPDLFTHYSGADYTGAFVFHCHKLTHEDHGMMELIELCAPDDLDCLCLVETSDGTGCEKTHGDACLDGDYVCNRGLAATQCYTEEVDTTSIVGCLLALGAPGELCGACEQDGDCPPKHPCEYDAVCGEAMTCTSGACRLESGEPCVGDDDCASGTCSGPPGPTPRECD